MRFLFLLSMFSLNVFIVISAFLKQVMDIDIEPLYYPFIVVIALLNLCYFTYLLFVEKKVNKSFLLLFLFTFVLIVAFLSSGYNHTKIVQNNMLLYLIWSMPAALAGIYVARIDKSIFEKFCKVIFYTFSILLIMTILIPYLRGKLETPISIGLMNYQNVSYIAAFTTGLGFYFTTASSIKHKLLYLIVSLLLIPIVVIAGGRGGAVVIIIYFVITLINIYFNKKVHAFYKVLLLIGIIASLIAFANLVTTIDKEGRLFSYITDDGISLEEGSSGRDVVYKMDMNAISKKPVFGYGLFNYYQHTFGVPHNLILEIILIGGYFLLILFIIFSIYLLVKYIRFYRKDKSDRLTLYIFVYPITLLMFSTNFLIVSEFWFFIFYILSRNNKGYINPNNKKIEEA
ncbi:O-antigen ligase family protein [Macrococcus equi]|uniref:O-antigen ligase family protein n=1 Tax=Macrococcus equi TaxID=3395462 RepID=UPI0039BDEF75